MKFQLLDGVRLAVTVSECAVASGTVGTVVEVFTEPNEAYLVEFCDEQGRTVELFALLPGQLEPYPPTVDGGTDKYMEVVQLTARRQGQVFFIDSGEGHEWSDPTSEWHAEDLCGWLVPLSEENEFRSVWREGRKAVWASDRWTDYHCFVFWERVPDAEFQHPPIVVRFKFYPSQPD